VPRALFETDIPMLLARKIVSLRPCSHWFMHKHLELYYLKNITLCLHFIQLLIVKH